MLELKRQIQEAEQIARDAQLKVYELKRKCTHQYEEKYSSAVCTICGDHAGWWCPDSPTHACNYEQEDGTIDYDCCRYCGDPEERK